MVMAGAVVAVAAAVFVLTATTVSACTDFSIITVLVSFLSSVTAVCSAQQVSFLLIGSVLLAIGFEALFY